MSGSNDGTRDELIKLYYKNASVTPPTTLWVHLFTANPNSAGGGTEVSTAGTGYAAIGVTTAGWTTNGVGSVINNAALVYTTNAAGGWGTVTGVAITDSSVHAAGSTYKFWAPLTASVTVNAADIVQFSSAALQVAFSS